MTTATMVTTVEDDVLLSLCCQLQAVVVVVVVDDGDAGNEDRHRERLCVCLCEGSTVKVQGYFFLFVAAVLSSVRLPLTFGSSLSLCSRCSVHL